MIDGAEEKETGHRLGGQRVMSDQEVVRLWQLYKSGATAPCPRDHAPLALAVNAIAKSYRLVCTLCGNSSGWFEAALTGVHVRNVDDTATYPPEE